MNKRWTRQGSSMIHSASPQSQAAVIVAWFWSFGMDRQKDGRTNGQYVRNCDHYRLGLWSVIVDQLSWPFFADVLQNDVNPCLNEQFNGCVNGEICKESVGICFGKSWAFETPGLVIITLAPESGARLM